MQKQLKTSECLKYYVGIFLFRKQFNSIPWYINRELKNDSNFMYNNNKKKLT